MTRLLDFEGFKFILAHFKAVLTLASAKAAFGVDTVIRLISSMKPLVTSIFLPCKQYCSIFPNSTYSIIRLKAIKKRITEAGHPAKIPFSYLTQSELTPEEDERPHRPS